MRKFVAAESASPLPVTSQSVAVPVSGHTVHLLDSLILVFMYSNGSSLVTACRCRGRCELLQRWISVLRIERMGHIRLLYSSSVLSRLSIRGSGARSKGMGSSGKREERHQMYQLTPPPPTWQYCKMLPHANCCLLQWLVLSLCQ